MAVAGDLVLLVVDWEQEKQCSMQLQCEVPGSFMCASSLVANWPVRLLVLCMISILYMGGYGVQGGHRGRGTWGQGDMG